MSKQLAALALAPEDRPPYLTAETTPLADDAQCHGERTARELPPAIQIYATDIGEAIIGAGMAWNRLMEAQFNRRADVMALAVAEIEDMTNKARVLSAVMRRKIALHRNRCPQVKD